MLITCFKYLIIQKYLHLNLDLKLKLNIEKPTFYPTSSLYSKLNPEIWFSFPETFLDFFSWNIIPQREALGLQVGIRIF